jgi:hypothetical protein
MHVDALVAAAKFNHLQGEVPIDVPSIAVPYFSGN